jgi:hypothetical protein
MKLPASVVFLVLAIGLLAPQANAAPPTLPSASCANPLGPVAPPPNAKPQPPSLNGVTALDHTFKPGVIRVRILCGLQINEVLAPFGLAQAQYLSPGPFDASDHRGGFDRSFRVPVPRGTEKKWVQTLWRARAARFDRVQLDWTIDGKATMSPNDPRFASQGNLQAANLPVAWDRTVSWDAIVIGVIDSGLRATHEEFPLAKQKTGYDYVRGIDTPPGSAVDSNQVNGSCFGGHGTQVSSIAAGATNNGLGTAGAGFNSSILPIRALNGSPGNCLWASSTRDWPIRTARSYGSLIINMSYEQGTLPDDWEQDAIREAYSLGVMPVTASANRGNDYNSYQVYPCAYLYITCVAAAYNNRSLCGVSGYGAPYVDFSAPAENAWGAGAGFDWDYIYDPCHTSYAAPLVSGVMALLRSIGKDPAAQFNALVATAHPEVGSHTTAYGFIDAGNALWQP